MILVEPPYDKNLTCVVGLGNYSNWHFHYFSNGGYEEGTTSIIYYKKNGVICGNEATVGIHEQNNNISITISPNPFTTTTTITFNEEQKNTTVKITDVLGKEIKTININGKQCVIEKGEMKPGVYFVEVKTGREIINRKIVVQ